MNFETWKDFFPQNRKIINLILKETGEGRGIIMGTHSSKSRTSSAWKWYVRISAKRVQIFSFLKKIEKQNLTSLLRKGTSHSHVALVISVVSHCDDSHCIVPVFTASKCFSVSWRSLVALPVWLDMKQDWSMPVTWCLLWIVLYFNFLSIWIFLWGI